MHLQARPLDDWHGPPTRRRPSPFAKGTTYGATLDVLDLELRSLGASACVLLLDVSERDCRLDGSIRADARPASPRVALAFDSRHGPLRYQCDTFTEWRANVRAIALALEALRKVDRYGVGSGGEQYRGWQQLGPGAMPLPGPMSLDDAAAFLAQHAGAPITPRSVLESVNLASHAYRLAAKRLHPDAGGDAALFSRLDEARRLLTAAAG